MFKKLLIAALLLVTTACTTHHSFMDKAVVGYVDDSKTPTVLFHVGNRFGADMYKPQFSSDCTKLYNVIYQSDNTSTGCFIRAERISHMESYREHTGNVQREEYIISNGTHQQMEDISNTVSSNLD